MFFLSVDRSIHIFHPITIFQWLHKWYCIYSAWSRLWGSMVVHVVDDQLGL